MLSPSDPSTTPPTRPLKISALDALRPRILFWWILALVPVHILLLGYVFGEGDQNEQFPMILRALDPQYLRNDWIVNSNAGFNHRWFYTQFIALLARVFTFEGACYLLFILSVFAWVLGAAAFFQEIWEKRHEPSGIRNAGASLHGALAVGGVLAAALMLFAHWGAISSNVTETDLTPAALVWPAMIWFGVLIRRGQLKWASVLLLVAGMLHALIAPCSGIFLLVAQYYAVSGPEGDSQNRRALLRHAPLWSVSILLPLAIAMFSTKGNTVSAAQAHDVLNILTYVRHPWHYVPLSWDRRAWFSVFAWLAFVLVARRGSEPSRFLDGLIGVVLLFCLCGFLPFLVPKLFPLVKLQPFRMTIWLEIAGNLYIARWIGQLCTSESRERRLAGAIFFLSLVTQTPIIAPTVVRMCLPVGAALFIALDIQSQRKSFSRYLALLPLLPWLPIWSLHLSRPKALLAILTLAICFLALSKKSAKGPRIGLRLAQGIFGIGMVLTALSYKTSKPSIVRKLTSKVEPHFTFNGDNGPLYRWMREKTPKDAIFIIPPDLEQFRLHSNRAIVADFKVFPWTDSGLLDWRNRIKDLCGGKTLSLGYNYHVQLNDAYATLTPGQVKGIATKYGATYFLALPQSKSNFSHWPLIYNSKGGRLYRIITNGAS